MVLRFMILGLCFAFAAQSADAQQEKVVSGKVGSNSAYAEVFDTSIADFRNLLQTETTRISDLLSRLERLEKEHAALLYCNAQEKLLDSFIDLEVNLDLNCRAVVVDPCETCNPAP